MSAYIYTDRITGEVSGALTAVPDHLTLTSVTVSGSFNGQGTNVLGGVTTVEGTSLEVKNTDTTINNGDITLTNASKIVADGVGNDIEIKGGATIKLNDTVLSNKPDILHPTLKWDSAAPQPAGVLVTFSNDDRTIEYNAAEVAESETYMNTLVSLLKPAINQVIRVKFQQAGGRFPWVGVDTNANAKINYGVRARDGVGLHVLNEAGEQTLPQFPDVDRQEYYLDFVFENRAMYVYINGQYIPESYIGDLVTLAPTCAFGCGDQTSTTITYFKATVLESPIKVEQPIYNFDRAFTTASQPTNGSAISYAANNKMLLYDSQGVIPSASWYQHTGVLYNTSSRIVASCRFMMDAIGGSFAFRMRTVSPDESWEVQAHNGVVRIMNNTTTVNNYVDFVPRKWYKIDMIADLAATLWSVYVDDVLAWSTSTNPMQTGDVQIECGHTSVMTEPFTFKAMLTESIFK